MPVPVNELYSDKPSPAKGAIRRRVAAALDRWAGGPRRKSNRTALLFVTLLGLAAVTVTWSLPDRTMALRLIGLSLFAAHVIANKWIIRCLAWLRDRGLPEAGRALDAYLGPGQLTSLDLGLIWVGVAAFAPLLDLVSPAPLSFAG